MADHDEKDRGACGQGDPATEGWSSRTQRGEPVVRQVLKATVEELARIGYGALSIEEVARRAGVNKTTVYRRWASKAELVRAVLVSLTEDKPPAPDTGSLRGDLLVMARHAAEFAQSSSGRMIIRMLMAEGMEPELAAIARNLRQEHQVVPRSVFARAARRGEVADADPGLLFEALIGLIFHQLFILHEPVDDAFLERVVDLLLHGARRRGG